jgi:hypothetical protein
MTSHLRTPVSSQTSHSENTCIGTISPHHILIKSVRKTENKVIYFKNKSVSIIWPLCIRKFFGCTWKRQLSQMSYYYRWCPADTVWSSSTDTESGVMSPSPKPSAWTNHQGSDWDWAPSHQHEQGRWPGLSQIIETSHSLLKRTEKKILMRIQNNSIMALFRVQRSDSPSTLPSSVGSPSSVS